MSDPSPTVQRRRLGDELRKLRDAKRLTGAQVAEMMECTQSKISKIESGQRGIAPKELRELLDIYDVTDQALREQLLSLARSGSARGWWAPYASSLSPNYASFIGFESAATEIHGWEPMLIHGPLQTEGYARAVIRATQPEISISEVERRVEIRMARQRQLAKTQPRLWAIMDESALRRAPDRQTMREQLQRLLDAVDEPQVTIQVAPLGLHAGVMGSLTILRFKPPDPEVIYLETAAGDVYPEGDVARACRLAYDHLRAFALDSSASTERIAEVMREL